MSIDRPVPPPGRVEYRGMLSSFVGPEDKFEAWRSTWQQRLIRRIEPVVAVVVPVLVLGAIFAVAVVTR